MHSRKILISGLVLSAVCLTMFTSCGRMPPDDLWTWSSTDSTQIAAIVEEWKPILRSSFEETPELVKHEEIKYVPSTADSFLRLALKNNRFKQRFFPKNFQRTLTYTVLDSAKPVLDTTVTVKLAESIEGFVTIYTDSMTRFLQETIVGGLKYNFYDNRFSRVETTITTPFTASVARYLHFEPDNKANPTSWHLKRISGGANIPVPDEAGAAYIFILYITTKSGRRDTFYLRPDSLHHGIQRLYSPDSLLTYSVNDTISILIASGTYDPIDGMAFLQIPDSGNANYSIRRTMSPIPADTTSFMVHTPGLKRVYVEFIPWASLMEYVAKYSARIWEIPILIKE